MTYQTPQASITRSPFYDRITIDLPDKPQPLVIISEGASNKPYIAALKVNGQLVKAPIINHSQIMNGGEIEFIMSDEPTAWASETLVCCTSDAQL
jgi:putative alpha-1,2-mannosidase